MSSDHNHLDVLTPGHSLIGRSPSNVAESDLTSERDSYLSQWQKLSKIIQLIRQKWKLYYLNNLQGKHK